jgi:hypothetical protein
MMIITRVYACFETLNKLLINGLKSFRSGENPPVLNRCAINFLPGGQAPLHRFPL